MRKGYRFCTLILAVMMLVCVPVPTFAAGGVTEISSAESLRQIDSNLAGSYILTRDIDLSGTDWTPIGASAPFTGTFDGNGHTITGLHGAGANGKNGLFGTNNGTIKNLTVSNGSLSGSAPMAGAIAAESNGTITGCTNAGVSISISCSTEEQEVYVGGIAGRTGGGQIADCTNKAPVTAKGKWRTMTGGIVGYMEETSLTNCRNIGAVTGDVLLDNYTNETAVGGIAGDMSGSTISRSSNAAAVKAQGRTVSAGAAGGIAGNQGSGSSISECYNDGKIEGCLRAGGIAGDNHGIIRNSYNTAKITGGSHAEYVGGIAGGNFFNGEIYSVYNIGLVEGGDQRGGLTGENAGTLDRNTYTASWGSEPVGGWSDGEGVMLSSDAMAKQSSFTSFDFSAVWKMGNGDYKFPVLRNCAAADKQGGITVGWRKENGEWYFYTEDSVVLKNGWAQDSKGWCWMGSDGRITKNKWIETGGYEYYLKPSGYRAQSEWLSDSNGYRWVDGSGRLAKNKWVKSGGDWYYMNAKGYRAVNAWAKDSHGWCWMGSDGRIVKSKWIKDKGEWYYLKANGYMAANEWAKDRAGWMWMNSSGKITKNKWIKDKGEWYFLKKSGYMAANEWAKDSKGWMYMTGSGRMYKKHWLKWKGEWYYLKASGYMAADEWAKDSHGWMYMAASGKITKAKWLSYKGSWYYLLSNGYMATGTHKIGSKTYSFDASGKWIK